MGERPENFRAMRGRQVSDAEFRRLYLDKTKTLADIGKELGITERAVASRAAHRGLPARGRSKSPTGSTHDSSKSMTWLASVHLIVHHIEHHGKVAAMSDYAELKARLRDGCNLQQRDGEQAAAAIDAEVKRRKQAEEKLRYWLGEYATVLAGRADEHDRADAADAAADAANAAAYAANAAAYAARAAAEQERAKEWQRAQGAEERNRKLKARAEAAEARVTELEWALLWCSGSNDFNEGGVARKGWLKICAPLLAALQEDKSHE